MIRASLNSAFRRPIRPRPKVSWTSDWVCKSCRASSSLGVKQDPVKKPYYVTTPIFYVNAAPHVGHLYTMVLTDILKRWQVLKGNTAILCTGTDEHGMKIQQAAAKADTPPKDFCDRNAETFKTLARLAGLSNDHFVRTTDEDHKQAVQYFWYLLKEREYIYESKHEGWYCVSDETFYPESAIEKRLDPVTGRTFMASQETGKEVEWTSERNYHFRLSHLKDQLLDFYKENPDFVVPSSRMNDVVKWVSEGLEDLSVSRPVERLTWGIRVPDDESQTIYVWLDALVNYITKAGYPWTPGKETAGGWPADVQVIGKDIVRFHCIYWPAFLLALGLQPPKQILTHAHWTLQNRKMAKSTGNVVNPFFALERFGVDAMRYYLAHDGGIANDTDYGNQYIVERYKKGLQGGIGNLLNRTAKSKMWNVRDAVKSATTIKEQDLDPTTVEQIEILKQLPSKVEVAMAKLNPGLALQQVMDAVYATNKYLSDNEPWIIFKLASQMEDGAKKDEKNAAIMRTIYHSVEAIRITGILLQPYMPTKASELLDLIGVEKARRGFEFTAIGSDADYGSPLVDWPEFGLFPQFPVED
ncbi:putative methionyl-tRNA synthetase [Coleophoma cylindrospora]|uniref:Probable methionine--tRNA ligase, mitochondrial n=1 Tax=Coleophoma cylindrospora TaxID=1849047 RepID=A0A3D8QT43_9HELO|nr:putative methionyl-tRNA synthetase [Coleophoma cylindrospora]